jgi:hypothetical protein
MAKHQVINTTNAYDVAVQLARQGWGLGELQAVCVKAKVELSPEALHEILMAQRELRSIKASWAVGW